MFAGRAGPRRAFVRPIRSSGGSLAELRAQSPIDRSSRSLPHVYVLRRRCRLSPDHAIAAIAPSDRRRQRWNNWSPWPRVAPRLAKSRSWVHSWLIMFCYRREAVIACPSHGYLFCHTVNDEIEMAGDPAPGKSLATFADSARSRLRGVVCATTAGRPRCPQVGCAARTVRTGSSTSVSTRSRQNRHSQQAGRHLKRLSRSGLHRLEPTPRRCHA